MDGDAIATLRAAVNDPEARVRDAVSGALESMVRLPRLVDRAEKALVTIEGGLKLDPDTTRALRGGRPSRLAGLHVVLGIIAGLLAALVAIQLI